VCLQACVVALAGLLIAACGSAPETEPADAAPAEESTPATPMLPDVIVA